MRVDEFDFDLPEERIALEPAPARDGARLLYVAGKGDEDRHIRDLPDLLAPGDLLVFNDTKVIPAQLSGLRPARAVGGGGDVTVDVTLHKALPQKGAGDMAVWDAFVRPAKRLKIGDRINFFDLNAGDGRCDHDKSDSDFYAEVIARDGASARLQFNKGLDDFDAALARVGVPPLPPYIARKRSLSDHDKDRYQTIYADRKGSVAAPTAGLHFTQDLFERLDAAGVKRAMVTLHVGAGTFLPVSAEDTNDHVMHAEWGEVTAQTAAMINETRMKGGRVIAVGTTSLRLLESAAGSGGHMTPFADETDIFITPGYEFRVVDGLITNFHLPRSTLFMLVCALAGTARMRAAYAHAIAAQYRFYSYGDACFLLAR